MTGDVILEDCADYNAGQELDVLEQEHATVFYDPKDPVAWLQSTVACELSGCR